MTERRQFLKAGAALAAVGPRLARADERPHLWQGHDFAPGRPSQTGSTRALRHRAGRGLVHDRDDDAVRGARPQPRPRPRRLRVEENGPALAAREGGRTLEQSVEALASLPFVDVLYVRCDWRDVQSRPAGSTSPRCGPSPATRPSPRLRVAFRVQLSNPEIQPGKLALPDFLQPKVRW